MSLAQKDQLLEIGSRARLGKPIICRRLSVSCDKSRTFRLMKFEQIFSLRCQTEQAASQKLTTNLYTNDGFSHRRSAARRMTFVSSLLDTSARSAGSSQTATIPSGLRKWWSRTGSNRRHPACKAGALPAELRPLIVFPIEPPRRWQTSRRWWAWEDLNLRPHAYQARALTN